LKPEDILKEAKEAMDPTAPAFISTVGPDSTTALLAAQVPSEAQHEEKKDEQKDEQKDDQKVDQDEPAPSPAPPGGYPVSPAAADQDTEFKISPLPATEGAVNPTEGATESAIDSHVTLDKESYEQSDRIPGIVSFDAEKNKESEDLSKEVSVNPLPATEGAVNPPEGVTAGSVTDNVTLDKESYEKSDRIPGIDTSELDREVKINPLPATEGAVNPIKLEPGEKIPESITSASVTDHVTLDKESYEKSDRIPGIETELPPVSANTIPESSLPIVGANDNAFINTVGPTSTTADLAALVSLEEPKVPEIVKESQEKAGAEPGASGMSEPVKEKAAVEDELIEKVDEVPPAAEGTAGEGAESNEKTLTEQVLAAGAAASAAVIGAAATAQQAAANAQQTATEAVVDAASKLPESVKQVLPAALQEEAKPEENKLPTSQEVEEAVAQEVAPLKEVVVPETPAENLKYPETEATPEPVPAPAAAPAPEAAPEVPAEVKDSIKEAGGELGATANAEAVDDKKEVEAELLKEVKPTEPIAPVAESSSKPEEASKTEETKEEAPKPAEEVKTETNGATAPAATAEPIAVETPAAATAPATTETTPAAPATETVATNGSKATSETPATDATATTAAEKKKKNRLSSIFNKIKHKLSGDKA